MSIKDCKVPKIVKKKKSICLHVSFFGGGGEGGVMRDRSKFFHVYKSFVGRMRNKNTAIHEINWFLDDRELNPGRPAIILVSTLSELPQFLRMVLNLGSNPSEP
jgi:hypothetical protein